MWIDCKPIVWDYSVVFNHYLGNLDLSLTRLLKNKRTKVFDSASLLA